MAWSIRAKQTTGVRDISALSAIRSAGMIQVVRDGNRVSLQIADASFAAAGAQAILTLPVGFRPSMITYAVSAAFWTANKGGVAFRATTAGVIETRALTVSPDTYNVSMSWRTTDPFPTVDLGVKA